MIWRVIRNTAVRAFRRDPGPSMRDVYPALALTFFLVVITGTYAAIAVDVILFCVLLFYIVLFRRVAQVFTTLYRLKRGSDRLNNSIKK
ncbi:hypothetical protein ACFLRF_02760 [Candidatus Altiarchaeota archaeon]